MIEEKQFREIPIIEKTVFSIGKREQTEEWDCYTANEKKICIAADRENAFHRIVGAIPLKGLAIAALTAFFAKQAVSSASIDIIDNPQSHVLVAKNLPIIPLRFAVYGYLVHGNETGGINIWSQYQKGVKNICGYTLPHGLKENQQYPQPLFIPVMKEHAIPKEAIYAEGLLEEEILEEIEMTCLRVFALGAEHAQKQKLILAAAIYEFGQENGKPVLLHGFHMPQTALYWDASLYGKNFAEGKPQQRIVPATVLRWLDSVGFKGNGPAPPIPDNIRLAATNEYMSMYEKLTGKKLMVPKGDFVKEMEKVIKQQPF